jgi:hypothetical protein
MSIDLCPICIEHPGTNFTECNHGFCVSCLSRIKKCAMCRHPLQRAKICVQIQEKFNLIDSERTNYDIGLDDDDIVIRSYLRRRINLTGRVYSREVNLPEITHIRRNYINSNRILNTRRL